MAGAFADLKRTGKYNETGIAFLKIIKKSFTEDGSRETQDEVRRRGNIIMDGFNMLRTDAKYRWSVERILNELPRYLRCKLDGIPYEPSTRTIWLPEDGRG